MLPPAASGHGAGFLRRHIGMHGSVFVHRQDLKILYAVVQLVAVLVVDVFGRQEFSSEKCLHHQAMDALVFAVDANAVVAQGVDESSAALGPRVRDRRTVLRRELLTEVSGPHSGSCFRRVLKAFVRHDSNISEA
jgi:hypothetical protein